MLVLSVLVAALAATPVPVPKPTPTNPFTLDPIVRTPAPLPLIGTTRSRPVCTAIRQAIAPAVQAALKNDQLFTVFRGGVYDYTVKETESTRDLRLMQMDHGVQELVKSIDALEKAVKSPALDIPATASPEDAATLRKARASLEGVLQAQKTQLDAMSGFVETEQMTRFGKLSETEQAMVNATNPDVANTGQQPFTPSGGEQTPMPTTGFLRDYNTVFKKNLNEGSMSLTTARLLDHDLGDMQAFTAQRESIATAVIVPAARACSAPASPAPSPSPLPSSEPVRPQG
ncbi:MAG TPA: hypothetical protein VMA36_05525 [Candidatus Limnocylindria bacterium]|nr:hypothetical protein [Candidatus Limnocylindria bacterium]